MFTSFSRKTRLKTLGHAGDFIELSDLSEFLHTYLVTPRGGEVNYNTIGLTRNFNDNQVEPVRLARRQVTL